jgi:hypothetical protein
MKNKWHKKAIVFGIIVILICSTFFPGISSKKVKPEQDEIINNDAIEVEDELATLTFNTFNENGKKENKIELPISKAKYIFNLFEKLRNMTISEPNSQETLDLKNRFIDLLEEYGLIPSGMSTSDIQPLINPHGSPDNPRSRGRTGFLGLIIDILFSNRFNHLRLLGPLDYPSDWSIFCNVAGGGYGIPLPLFILPRPRFITVWGATFATTAVGSLVMPKSFVAIGNQQGICLGFVGVGITIAFFGFMGYGMLGYSLYTAVRAQEIERYNNEPTVTNENPPDGSTNVPTSLSELSFRLTDADGDLMSYSVTTSPYIGSDSGSNKVNGVYSVPVSGLEGNTDYTWHVTVDDGYDIVDKTFTFRTEIVAPVISNPSPSDGELDVSVDLSQLSFHLRDYQGNPMDYTVTTSPDIGSGSGNGVGEGTYSVPVSGLEGTSEYTWYVTATDGVHETNKVFSFKTAPLMVFDPFDEGWQYRKKTTIDHAKVDGELENFPVLISLTDSDLSDKAQNDGDDILFMDGPGVANRLYHEIEYYEDSNGVLVAWVNIPSLSSSEDTVLYMYYGNPSCSNQEYHERVWNSDYVAIYHLDGSSYNEIDDSTSNNLDVVGYQGNPVYHQTGKIGFCIDFDEDSLSVNDNNLLSFTDGSGHDKPMTIESWIKFDCPGGSNTPIVSKFGHGKREWNYVKNPSDLGLLYLFDEGSEGAISRSTESTLNVDNTGWNYLSVTYNGDETGTGISFVLDGQVDEGVPFTGSAYNGMKNLAEPMRIGSYHSTNENQWYYWYGLIDEVRISKIDRSSNWLTTSFNTMNDPSSFFSVGPEESAP